MGVNKAKPHVFVLPEDDANRQLANGFLLEVDFARQRQMRVLPVADGWVAVLEHFLADHVREMESNAEQSMVLLIDFDQQQERLQDLKAKIPIPLADRVFIVGSFSEPEALKSAGLGSYEKIGRALARDCREETDTTWGHELLRHNAGELARLREHVRPILF